MVFSITLTISRIKNKISCIYFMNIFYIIINEKETNTITFANKLQTGEKYEVIQ